MTEYCQHYRVPATDEHRMECVPGQYVLDDAGNIMGFISNVTNEHVEAMLMQPVPVDGIDLEDITVIAESGVDWEARLKEILANNPLMWKLWEPTD